MMRSVSSRHGGEHDDRHLGLGAQPARELQPAFARQHQVQHHQLEMPVDEGAAGLLAVARGGDAQALAFQEFGQQVADFAVVIDDQNMRHGFHGCYNSRLAPGVGQMPLQLVTIW